MIAGMINVWFIIKSSGRGYGIVSVVRCRSAKDFEIGGHFWLMGIITIKHQTQKVMLSVWWS